MFATGGQINEVMQPLMQRLPVGAVRPAGRMGEIRALSVQEVSTNHPQCTSFSKTSEYGNPVCRRAARLGVVWRHSLEACRSCQLTYDLPSPSASDIWGT
jgi:hypothetical protein